MSDDKKTDDDAPEAEAVEDAAETVADESKKASSEAQEKAAAAAKAAQKKAAEAAKVASEKTAAAAAKAREEASRSYDEARSSISDADERTIAIVSYILFLANSMTGGIGAIVGVILSYLKKDTGDPVLDSHFEYQIRTFWIGLAGAVVGMALVFTLIGAIIGVPLLFALAVWWLLRNIVGLIRIIEVKPIPDPKTWFV